MQCIMYVQYLNKRLSAFLFHRNRRAETSVELEINDSTTLFIDSLLACAGFSGYLYIFQLERNIYIM